MALVLPQHAATSRQLCSVVWSLAIWKKSAGCDVLLAAGIIPIVFDILRSWPSNEHVTTSACTAVYWLAKEGSASVKSALRSVPDCEALLSTIAMSGLDISHEYTSRAADALRLLGLPAPW